MRWTSLIVAGMLSCSILSTRAKADPILLTLSAEIPRGIYFDNYPIDVTDGFEGFSITKNGGPPVSVPGPFELPFEFYGTVHLTDKPPVEYVEFRMVGSVSGYVFPNYRGDLVLAGIMSGSGSVSEISTYSSSGEPVEVPSWLPGLTVTISGYTPNRTETWTEVTMTLNSHPVPEPTPFAVLGAGLFALAVRRYRRRGSRAAI